MKKFLALFAMAALLFAFVGCSKGSDPDPVELAEKSFAEDFPEEWLSDWKAPAGTVEVGGADNDVVWNALKDKTWTSGGDDFTSGNGYCQKSAITYGADGKYSRTVYRHEKTDKVNYKMKFTYNGYVYVDNGKMKITVKNVVRSYYDIDKNEVSKAHWHNDYGIICRSGILVDETDKGLWTYGMYVRTEGNTGEIAGTWISESIDFKADGSNITVDTQENKVEITGDKTNGGNYKYSYSNKLTNYKSTEEGTWVLYDVKDSNYEGYKGDDYLQDDLLYIGRLKFTPDES